MAVLTETKPPNIPVSLRVILKPPPFAHTHNRLRDVRLLDMKY